MCGVPSPARKPGGTCEGAECRSQAVAGTVGTLSAGTCVSLLLRLWKNTGTCWKTHPAGHAGSQKGKGEAGGQAAWHSRGGGRDRLRGGRSVRGHGSSLVRRQVCGLVLQSTAGCVQELGSRGDFPEGVQPLEFWLMVCSGRWWAL